MDDKRVVLIFGIKRILVRTFVCGPEIVYMKMSNYCYSYFKDRIKNQVIIIIKMIFFVSINPGSCLPVI